LAEHLDLPNTGIFYSQDVARRKDLLIMMMTEFELKPRFLILIQGYFVQQQRFSDNKLTLNI
jgi:hypothetical protein